MEQVPFPQIGVQIATKHMCSLFYHANMNRSCFCILWHPQRERLSLHLPYFLLLHLRLPSLQDIRQLFRR